MHINLHAPAKVHTLIYVIKVAETVTASSGLYTAKYADN